MPQNPKRFIQNKKMQKKSAPSLVNPFAQKGFGEGFGENLFLKKVLPEKLNFLPDTL